MKVLITGATGGIGEEIIKVFYKNNYEIIAVGRDHTKLKYLEEIYNVKSYALNIDIEKEIDKFLISVNQNSIPIGMFAFAMKEENIKKENYEYDKLIYLKDYINYEKRCNYSKREYASMICQGKFAEMGDNIKKVIKWSEEKGYIMKGDTIIHILSGPAFEKDPSEVMYILRVPIKSIN